VGSDFSFSSSHVSRRGLLRRMIGGIAEWLKPVLLLAAIAAI
jgi:hypothetical protein